MSCQRHDAHLSQPRSRLWHKATKALLRESAEEDKEEEEEDKVIIMQFLK